MHVLNIQLDGKLPNLALMKLGHWHLSNGDTVEYTRSYHRDLFDQRPDRVYISCIFDFTQVKLMLAMHAFPDAIVGGTGTPFKKRTVDEIIGQPVYERHDYSGYPKFDASIGYAMRGCRMATPKSICRNFCVVPDKEGLPYSVNTIAAIWRGEPYPKHLHLLDNDFFGNPEWRERVAEIKDGDFKVCMSQGINTRLLNEQAAKALASIEYRDDSFTERRLYTAWDNFGDERVFFRGVDVLERNGIPSKHLMAFMLVGCDPEETWTRIWERFTKMVEREILPYPMVFRKSRTDLVSWQRYVIGRFYTWIPWGEYVRQTKSQESVEAWRPFADRLAAMIPKLKRDPIAA